MLIFRRLLLTLAVLALLLGESPALWAQCLPLEKLSPAVAAGRLTPDSLRALAEAQNWVAHPGKSPYWTYGGTTDDDDGETAVAWVGLRRSNGQEFYDLVYKTTRRECINQLRTELRRRYKFKSEYVNCVQCEAERLLGDGFTVTIFNQKDSYAAKRTAYPYVLVLRRDGPGTNSPPPPPGDSAPPMVAKP